jgi:predicted AAA+ superfamily ATPase
VRKIIRRLIDLELPRGKSAFIWGPRQVGKTYWLRHAFPRAVVIDLLKNDTFADYNTRPALLRERYAETDKLIVIDEVQKAPALLDEVHWLIENRKISFLLTGSSARKLKRGHANLLAGRAWRRVMVPLSRREVSELDLESVMISGLLPPHYLSPKPLEDLRAYVSDYLKEEIAAEALTQNLPAFAAFLRVVAITNSELINYTNVARECGVSAKVVRTYFDILEDTYLAYRVPPWTRAKHRRMIETEKFYLFDVGVANYLARRTPKLGSSEFGKAFEHYVLMELKAFQAYRDPELDIAFWRTSTGYEVDFILGEMQVAIEVKASPRVNENDARGLVALGEESHVGHRVIVCLEATRRRLSNGIDVWPVAEFIDALWDGAFG